MHRKVRLLGAIFLSILTVVCLWGCAEEQKEAELEVVDSEFSIRKADEGSFVIDAEGVIKNVGQVDVKEVEVTGYCGSCGEEVIDGEWFVSDYEKMEHQKDVIGYLAAGSEEEFEFEEVAICMIHKSQRRPEELPENLEVSIESYEIAE